MKINQINSLVLAYLGDSVYELLIRDYFIKQNVNKVNNLQNRVVKYVSAKAQSKYINYLIDNNILTNEELDIVKRGRNSKVYSHPKNVDVLTYKWATALESLFGYLYIKKEDSRIEELINIILEVEI
ncbi:MAG: ribonuclease III [Bacilli bacterium]|nr:ribonuclease III [Bacilli bacterium]